MVTMKKGREHSAFWALQLSLRDLLAQHPRNLLRSCTTIVLRTYIYHLHKVGMKTELRGEIAIASMLCRFGMTVFKKAAT